MKKITWQEFRERLKGYDQPDEIIYGVPKGGMIATAFLQEALVTHNPAKATMILDDIIDSGMTRDFYLKTYSTPFVGLYDKNRDGLTEWLEFPWETDHPGGIDNIQDNIIRQLQYIGEDPAREGIVETPNRIVRMWDEIFCGYKQDPADLLTTFAADGYDQIVLLKDIELYSICEHHMLPFYGKAHVAYIPNGKVIGISKLARLVNIFARRMQIQERIGDQVTGALMHHLEPKGAACIIEASHMCLRMRGVAKQNSTMVTSSMRGAFMDKPAAREELMQLIKR